MITDTTSTTFGIANVRQPIQPRDTRPSLPATEEEPAVGELEVPSQVRLQKLSFREPGRPSIYAAILMELEPEVVYTPGTITHLAIERGYVDNSPAARRKMRHSLARWASNHEFPRDGHGLVFIKGQAPTRGWYGRYWRQSVETRLTKEMREKLAAASQETRGSEDPESTEQRPYWQERSIA